MKLSEDGNTTVGDKIKLSCDCLGMSGGWTPMVHMHTQSGGKLDFRDEDQVFLPKEKSEDQISVGSCNGDFDLENIIDKTVNKINKFLDIDNQDYQDTNIICSKENDKRNKITKNLRCLICQGQSVYDSDSEFANSLKIVVDKKLQEGLSEDQIYEYFKTKYGEWILYDPGLNKNTYILWLLPILIFLIGGAIIYKSFIVKK